MTNASGSRPGAHPEFEWLIRLRWAAVVGIGLMSLFAAVRFSILMPWGIIAACLVTVAGSNLWAWMQRRRATKTVSTALILGDIILLTVLLYFTGGAHNPFTVLYLLHITLAVMLMDGRWAWVAVALCGGCFAFLFRSPHMLVDAEGVTLCDDLDFHLQGMLLATVVTGGGVVYFISRLNADLRHQREQASLAKDAAEREHRFASLVTMAAGVSHELATPLGTIAVASRELEMTAKKACGNEECLDDVALIRREVDRCRTVLERMSRQSLNPETDLPQTLRPEQIRERLPEYLAPAHAAGLRWQIEPDCPSITTPADALLRSLAIFIKNAFEASPPESSVALEMQRSGAGLHMRVRDQGSGMSPEVQTRLGEPFFTTKEAGMGIGLGFFLARALIEKIGGRIEVTSELEKGTEISIDLPLRSNSEN